MLQFFISSTPADAPFKDAFIRHLSSLRRAAKINVWSNSQIMPGAIWDSIAREHLRRADVVVVLVSSDFMASDAIWDNELRESLEWRKNGEALMLLPILVRPCVIKNTVIETIQGLPRNQTAVSAHINQDEAWYHIVLEITRLVENFEQDLANTIKTSAKHTASTPIQQIIGSKNVISGSVIIVGGNLILGDK